MRKQQNHPKGQSLVETALIIPLLLLLILTFVDLGRAIYYSSAIQNSVREGARYASVHKLTGDVTEVKDLVKNYSVAVNILDADIVVTPDTYVSGTTKEVTVHASYDFDPITPFLEFMFGGSITLEAESTMLLAPVAK